MYRLGSPPTPTEPFRKGDVNYLSFPFGPVPEDSRFSSTPITSLTCIMIRPLVILLPSLLVSLLFAGGASGQGLSTLEDDDLKSLATSLASYSAARESGANLVDAQIEVEAALMALSPALSDGNPLQSPLVLGRAVWLSKEFSAEKRNKGKVRAETFKSGSFQNGGIEFAYRLPRDYDPIELEYPLILAIPDVGELPTEHIRQNWVVKSVQDGAIIVCPQMPSAPAEWDQVMVKGRPGGLSHVLTALRIANDRFSIDQNRVYVCGRGKGVPAAMAAGNYSPHRFAGMIGRAGDAGELSPANFSNLPTFFTGAGARAQAFLEASAETNGNNCKVDPTGKEQDVWDWIVANPRKPFPTTVKLVVGDPFPTRAYWLRVAPMAPVCKVTATIERETNTIRIDGEGVSQVTLYLNDILVDLDKPLTVICNGVKRAKPLSPRTSLMLNMLADGTSDAGSMYVAQASYAMIDDASTTVTIAAPEQDDEFEQRVADAKGEATKLWEVYLWCLTSQRQERVGPVLRRIVRIDPQHRAAHLALGHIANEVQWFRSQNALDRFVLGQVEETAIARGLVQMKSLWIHPDERALALKRLVKDQETGQWLTGAERKRLDAGWGLQDLEWIQPQEAGKADDGLWKVGAEWLDLHEANQRHASIESMWTIPSAEVLLYSTADRDTSLRAIEQASLAIADMRKVFGAQPVLPLKVAVLKNEQQYDRFAFGEPDGRRPATDTGRMHVIHSAYFAESWFPLVDGEPEYRGAGVCFWDAQEPSGDLWGVHATRLATGLAYVNALDPSPNAVKMALKDRPSQEYYDAFLTEQQLPAWLRFGSAVYAQRFFFDSSTPADGDAWWARNWSIDNLKNRGGIRDLHEVMGALLAPDDRAGSRRRLLELGLVVSFMVDGGCIEVTEAHAELKIALAAGRKYSKQIAALTEALLANEAALVAFATK
jgi:hypothetical protein